MTKVYDILNCGPRHRFYANGKLVSNCLNAQNLNRKGFLRRAICAPKGWKVIACDSANIELRAGLTAAGQTDALAKIRNGVDLYCEFGTQKFKRVITKADAEERQFSKCAVLGLEYGMGANKFIDVAYIMAKRRIDIQESRETVNLYRQIFWCIPKAWKVCEEILFMLSQGVTGPSNLSIATVGKGCVMLPSGMPLLYPNVIMAETGKGRQYAVQGSDTAVLKARIAGIPPKNIKSIHGALLFENLIQGISRNIVMEQAVKIDRRLKIEVDPYASVVHTIHDEVVGIAPEDKVEQASAIFQEEMRRAPVWWPEIYLDAEVHWGDNYGECK